MKTFETEKGNIPEGATHYADETNADYFAWVKFIDGDAWRIMPDSDYFNEWEKYKTPNTKLIPQTKGVEWVDGLPPVGVECEFKYKVMTDADWKFCRVFGYSEHVAAVWYKSHDGETKHATIDVNYYEFRKPETEAERKEREEMEAAYDLLCIGNRALNVTAPCAFDEFKIDEPQCDFWLSIVRKTNYKVKGE